MSNKLGVIMNGKYYVPDEAAGRGEAVKEAGAKLVKAMFGVTLNPATPRPEASDAPDIVERLLTIKRWLQEKEAEASATAIQDAIDALAALRAELAALLKKYGKPDA